MAIRTSISVIVPVRNEARHLPACLDALAREGEGMEIIVVDGGSLDGTAEIAQADPRVRALSSEAGRARQMNAGALAATGDVLLFLHADTQLETGWSDVVRDTAGQPDFAIGAFRLALNSPRPVYRLIECGVRIRSALFRMPYGDQALFVRRKDFLETGGYPDVPLMEDMMLVRRMRQRGRLVVLSHRALSSVRNWERDGIGRRTARNLRTLLSYTIGGMNSEAAAKIYQGHRRAVIVFCRYPRPGTVKTRLADAVGDDQATALYRTMVRQALQASQNARGVSDVLVFFTPPDDLRAMQKWLGPEWVMIPQSDGDLGDRMLSAFETARDAGYTECAIVGTDCPELDAHHLNACWRRLRRADIVLGPARDGGYYLIAARRPHPELFRNMAWSTPDVLDETLRRLKHHRLRYALLPELRDLDDADDLADHRARGAL